MLEVKDLKVAYGRVMAVRESASRSTKARS